MPDNYITCSEEKGSINISEDAIVSMVRAAINEVEGVAGLSAPAGDIIERIGKKNAAKGVKVQIIEGVVSVDAIISVMAGANIMQVARQVQDAVLTAVESMTGMGAPKVNVHVAGVVFDK